LGRLATASCSNPSTTPSIPLCPPLRLGRPPTSPLFPYTTLFRSLRGRRGGGGGDYAGPRRSGPDDDRDAASEHAARSSSGPLRRDRKSTRLNSSHVEISYAVFCLKKKKTVSGAAAKSRRTARKVS